MKSIAVFCGSSDGNDDIILQEAYRLGEILAKKKIKLIYGGSQLGLMGQVANGVLENGGDVTGVIPDFLQTKEVVHPSLPKLVVTKDMHERKLKMHELSEGFIALPGGFGTFEELFEIVTWAQLGLHQNPIGILNSNGYYDDLIAMLKTMVRKGLLKKANFDLLLIAEDVDELLEKMANFKPLPVPKWLKESQT
ncbi:TIGR00730 family Rossman fold protein [Salegentibacter sp. F188]|uniref:Cytokinin riboside 5'-monophosphate phosphoribohydrolase n=1 Tax=Autumnicola patrickiae TaxID=3075591 RepID=A0ABU3DX71_9FLAO|nr:TIGR00730 family Rossman fold protein [Salegentibacter sp. F188]MDT0688293.1 TIGR00730 family Rossman fold protein [Salegentibacter sp. F188]